MRGGQTASLVPTFACGLRRSRALLVVHLLKRESRADGNQIEDGMRGVGRQAQTVKPFPGTNANLGRIRVRTLLGQLSAPPFRTLTLFLCKALGGSLDEVLCGRQCHACKMVTTLPIGYTSA